MQSVTGQLHIAMQDCRAAFCSASAEPRHCTIIVSPPDAISRENCRAALLRENTATVTELARIKKVLNCDQTLFPPREWGLGMRLWPQALQIMCFYWPCLSTTPSHSMGCFNCMCSNSFSDIQPPSRSKYLGDVLMKQIALDSTSYWITPELYKAVARNCH